MKKISTYEELIKYLLYSPSDTKEICVGIIGDSDISGDINIVFRNKLVRLLQGRKNV